MKYLQPWKREENYMGQNYYDYYVVIGRHRDSSVLDNHNYEEVWSKLSSVENELEEVDETEYGWLIGANFGHWAVGWIECIMIHKDAPHELIYTAEDLLNDLDQYPILNEDSFWQKIREEQERIWNDMSLRERVELCSKHDANIFTARHDDYWPEELDEVLEEWAME